MRKSTYSKTVNSAFDSFEKGINQFQDNLINNRNVFNETFKSKKSKLDSLNIEDFDVDINDVDFVGKVDTPKFKKDKEVYDSMADIMDKNEEVFHSKLVEDECLGTFGQGDNTFTDFKKAQKELELQKERQLSEKD